MSWLSPPVLWGLFAAVPAVAAELVYKKWPVDWPWWYGLPVWAPLQLMIGYGIFRLVQTPGATLLESFTVWAFATIAMRVVVSVMILGENVQAGTWFALGLILMARIAQTFWGR